MSRQIEQRVAKIETGQPGIDAERLARRIRLKASRGCVGIPDPWTPTASERKLASASPRQNSGRLVDLVLKARTKPSAQREAVRAFLKLARADLPAAKAVLATFKLKTMFGAKPERYPALLQALDKALAALPPAPVPLVVTASYAPGPATTPETADDEIDECDWLKRAETEAIKNRGVFTTEDYLAARAKRAARKVATPSA
jgi:hypothetical protein